MKKNLCLCLALCLVFTCISLTASAAPSRGDLFRFVPTIITVESNSVKVEGYFVNLNTDCAVKNLTDFEMTVYKNGDELISGNFGDLREFTVPSLSVLYRSFTFNGSHNLNEGVYNCNDLYYAEFGCSFKYVSN